MIGDAVELRLQPVIFDTTLRVEAQVLHDGAVGKVADVLGGDRVQPLLAFAAGEPDGRADASGPPRRRRSLRRAARRTGHRSATWRLRRVRTRERGLRTSFQPTRGPAAYPHGPMTTSKRDRRHPGRRRPCGRAPVAVHDPMFARGDGVFETLLLRGAGRPARRTSGTAGEFRGDRRVAAARPGPVARCRRGRLRRAWPDGARRCCGWCSARARRRIVASSPLELPDRVWCRGATGCRPMTLDRGLAAAAPAPWSIAGAKSLSYAVNAAALRHAERLGVGDVVLVAPTGSCWRGRGPAW